MAKAWDDVYNTMVARRLADPVLFRQMQAVRDRYNQDLVIPLADVEGKPELPAPSPALIADAIDNTAMRAASTQPVISSPSTGSSKAARKRAENRRRVLYGRWAESGLNDTLMARAYRHWCGYGTSVFLVKPRLDYEDYYGANVTVHNPMTVYPEPRNPDEARAPRDVGIVSAVSREWLERRFPEHVRSLFSKGGGPAFNETLWDVVEWWDEDVRIFGLLGPRSNYVDPRSSDPFWTGAAWNGIQLMVRPNKVGMVPVAAPRRVTLDRIEGQVAKMIDREDMLGKLYALEYVQAQKAVFPDMVALGENGRPPELVHGEWVDGRTGQVNLIMDARTVDVLRTEASVSAFAATDRLERSARLAGGVSPLFQGESPGASLRTGNAIDAAAGLAIDPRILEAHRVMSRNLVTVNEAIAKTELAFFKGRKLWTFTRKVGEDMVTEYDPGELFEETCLNAVAYQFPGADLSQVTVAIAQMVGAGLMSRYTGRAKHPHIDDPEDEARLDVVERLETALLAGLSQRAAQGELPEIDLANISKYVMGGDSLPDAVVKAQRDAQERQAAQSPPPAEGQAAPVEQMPGMANPGVGAEQAPPEAGIIGEPGGDLERLRQLLFNINFSSPEVA